MSMQYDFVRFNNLNLDLGQGSIEGTSGVFSCKTSLDGSEAPGENWVKVQGIFKGTAVECFIKMPERTLKFFDIQIDSSPIQVAHKINDFIVDCMPGRSGEEKNLIKFLMHHGLSVELVKLNSKEAAKRLFGKDVDKGNLTAIRSTYQKLLSENQLPEHRLNKKIIEGLYKDVLMKCLPIDRTTYSRISLQTTPEGLNILNLMGVSLGPAKFKKELEETDSKELWKKIDVMIDSVPETGYFFIGKEKQTTLGITDSSTPKEISQKMNDFIIESDLTLSREQKEIEKCHLHLGLNASLVKKDPLKEGVKLFGLDLKLENLDLIKDKYKLILASLKPGDEISKQIVDNLYKEMLTESLGLNNTSYSSLNLQMLNGRHVIQDFLGNERDAIVFKSHLSSTDDGALWKKIHVTVDSIPQEGFIQLPLKTQQMLQIIDENDPKKIARSINDFFMRTAQCSSEEKELYTSLMKLGISKNEYEAGPTIVGSKLCKEKYNSRKIKILNKRIAYFRDLEKLTPENASFKKIIDFIDPKKLSAPDNPFVGLFLHRTSANNLICDAAVDSLAGKLKTLELDEIYGLDIEKIKAELKQKNLYLQEIYRSEDSSENISHFVNNLIQFCGLEDPLKIGKSGNFEVAPAIEIINILQTEDFLEMTKKDKDELIESLMMKSNIRGSAKDAVRRIKEGNPVFISTGFSTKESGHHIELIFYKNNFVICNRGLRGAEYNIYEKFEYDPKKMDEKFLDYLDLIHHKFEPESQVTYQSMSIYEVFPKVLDAKKIKSSVVSPQVISSKDQKTCNCTKASIFAAVKMELYLKKLEETGLHREAASYSKVVGNKLSYLLRKKSIEKVEELIVKGAVPIKDLAEVQRLVNEAKRKLPKKLSL